MNQEIKAVSALLTDAQVVAQYHRQLFVEALDAGTQQEIEAFQKIWLQKEDVVKALLDRLIKLREDAIVIPQFGESGEAG